MRPRPHPGIQYVLFNDNKNGGLNAIMTTEADATIYSFLDAASHLYVCEALSVRPSVCMYVGPRRVFQKS